jgi:hypothetical protein
MLLIISLCVALSLLVWLSAGIPAVAVSENLTLHHEIHTSQVADDVLCLAKVDLLQQVAHLQLHIFDHLSDVGDVRGVIIDGHVGFYLAHHVARKIKAAKGFGVGTKRQDDG